MTSLTTDRQVITDAAATGLRKRPAIGSIAAKASTIGEYSMRFGLAAVIASIGAMKFTGYEAEAISGLVANSPLLSWLYSVLSVRGFSTTLGIFELLIASALAIGAFVPRVGIAAGIAAIGMFVTTLSFLFSTPGAFEPTLGGFPALSVIRGIST